jgi:hypothetical protein
VPPNPFAASLLQAGCAGLNSSRKTLREMAGVLGCYLWHLGGLVAQRVEQARKFSGLVRGLTLDWMDDLFVGW